MQGTDKCNAAHNSASKEPIRVGKVTDTDVRSNTQTYQGQTERSEVGSRLDSLEFVILFLSKTTTVCSQSLEPNVVHLGHMSLVALHCEKHNKQTTNVMAWPQ